MCDHHRELLKRINELREDPIAAILLHVAMCAKLTDEQLSETIQQVLEAVGNLKDAELQGHFVDDRNHTD